VPHDISYSDDGTKARITLDLADASLDADLDAIAARFVTLSNVNVDRALPLRRRGNIYEPFATDVHNSEVGLGFALLKNTYMFPVGGGSSYGSPASTSARVITSSGDATDNGVIDDAYSGGTTTDYGFNRPLTPGADLGSIHVLGAGHDWQYVSSGTPGGEFRYSPGIMCQYGGNNHAVESAGTAGATNGSTAVTGVSTAYATSHIGSYIIFTGDTAAAATRMAYRIVARASATAITIAEPYVGSTATGKTYRIISAAAVHGPTTVWAEGWARALYTTSYKGRLICACTAETANVTETKFDRIRWSGVIGSSEGSTGFIGVNGWSTTGFLDMSQGTITNVLGAGEQLYVTSSRGITRIVGSPAFDTAGSMDLTEWDNWSVSPGACCYTPYGFVFVDNSRGLCIIPDGGEPQEIMSEATTSLFRHATRYPAWSLGYYKHHVFCFSQTSDYGLQINMRDRRIAKVTGDTDIGFLRLGPLVNGIQPLVAVSLLPSRLVVVSNIIDKYDDDDTDYSSTAFQVDVKTGKIGSTLSHLKPTRAWLTYRCVDAGTDNPYIAATVTTGLPDTSDAAHTFTTTPADFAETVDVETKRVELNLSADPMMQIRLLQTNASERVELFSVVIDCDVLDEADSS
jgi:hypothetical protein